MARSHKSNEQQELVFGRKEKFKLLHSVDCSQLGISLSQWQSVSNLLEQIELCTHADGCNVRIEVLAARLNQSHRTTQRHILLAAELGVLIVERQPYRRGGQGPNRYQVPWHKLRAYSADECDSRKSVMALRQNVTPPRQNVMAPCHFVTPYKEDNPFLDPSINPFPWDSGGEEDFRKRLVACDVQDRSIIETVVERLSPEEANAIVDHFEAHPGAWGGGGLYMRLLHAKPGAPASEGWLPVDERWQREQDRLQREKRLAERQKQQAAEQERAEQERAENESLEAEYGSEFDAMSADDREQLFRSVYGPRGTVSWQVGWRGGQPRGLYRSTLLRELQNRINQSQNATVSDCRCE